MRRIHRTHARLLTAAVLATSLVGIPASPVRAQQVTPGDLKTKIARIRASLDRVADALHRAEDRLDEAEARATRHRRALAEARRRTTILQAAIGRRAGDLYRMGAGVEFGALFSSTDLSELVDRFVYLQKVREGERGQLEDVRALRLHAAEQSRALGGALRAARRHRNEFGARRSELSKRLREYGILLRFLELSGGTRTVVRASRSGPRGFVCPVVGPRVVTNNFGDRRPGGPHTGIDIQADYGQRLVAVLPGRIVATPRGGWIGRGVIMRDIGGNEWWYAHLGSVGVRVGETVVPGSVVGRVGCSGRCYGPHLHFEWHPGGGGARNPYRILRASC